MSKHTPGPWKATGPKYGALAWIESRERRGVNAIACLDGSENVEADARLIAAAPAMLYALKDFLEWADGFHDADTPYEPEWIFGIRNLVRKIEGKES